MGVDVPADAADVIVGESVAAGVGALYVIEGSTLGGRVIARHLLDRGVPADHCSYFRGVEDDPALWKQFRATAGRHLQSEDGLEEAVQSALDMFGVFESQLGALVSA